MKPFHPFQGGNNLKSSPHKTLAQTQQLNSYLTAQLKILNGLIEANCAEMLVALVALKTTGIETVRLNKTEVVKKVKAPHLSKKEREIMLWTREQYSTAQIAKGLGVTTKTIHTHRSNICAKYGVASLDEAYYLSRGGA